jgi:hypothetical protein
VLAFLALAELVALPAFALFFSGSTGGRSRRRPRRRRHLRRRDAARRDGGRGRARELILPLLFLPLAIPSSSAASARVPAPGRYLGFLALYDAVFALSPGPRSSTWSRD